MSGAVNIFFFSFFLFLFYAMNGRVINVSLLELLLYKSI